MFHLLRSQVVRKRADQQHPQDFQRSLEGRRRATQDFHLQRRSKNCTANDQLRDNCSLICVPVSKTSANALASPVREVAEKILATIDKYNLRISVGIDKETGLLRNIIDDLKKVESFTEALATMGMKPVFDEMERTNQAVAQAQDARDRLNEQRTVGGMAEARRATDEAYGNLCFILESAAAMFGAPFKTDIPAGTLPSTATRPTSNTSRLSTLPSARRRRPTSPSRNLSPKVATNPSQNLSLNPKAETAKLKAATLKFRPRKYILNESHADSPSAA